MGFASAIVRGAWLEAATGTGQGEQGLFEKRPAARRAVLYNLLASRLSFHGETVTDTLKRALNTEPLASDLGCFYTNRPGAD